MAAPAIEAVIFDIGNVLVRWDPRFLYEKIISEPQELEFLLSHVITLEWHTAHDAGLPLAEGISRRIAQFPEHEAAIRAFGERWLETLGPPIKGSVEVVKALHRRNLPLYALTNFSAETYPLFAADFPAMQLFRDVLVSGHIGLVKPDPRIFEAAIKRFAVDPKRVVFIDDRMENIRAGEEFGMIGVHFTNAEELRLRLSALGLL